MVCLRPYALSFMRAPSAERLDLSFLPPKDVVSLCWALGRMEHTAAASALEAPLAAAATRLLPRMTPRQMAVVLWGVGAAVGDGNGGSIDRVEGGGGDGGGGLKAAVASRAQGEDGLRRSLPLCSFPVPSGGQLREGKMRLTQCHPMGVCMWPECTHIRGHTLYPCLLQG